MPTDNHTGPRPVTIYGPRGPRKGLGDLVASVAQPIAKAIDRVAGTNIQHCGGCKRRQAALNALGDKLTGAGS
jgi:hypothetical protein